MLFKKRVTVTDYCEAKVTRLFSQEREVTWDDLRNKCNDPSLNRADRNLYHDNLRAVMLQLMSIALAKTYWGDIKVLGDASVFEDGYLNEHGFTRIASLKREYNRAFGSSSTDGVEQMVSLFAAKLTQSSMGQATKRQFWEEFYTILRVLYEEFKSIKLVTT